jgi:hypothetical protein
METKPDKNTDNSETTTITPNPIELSIEKNLKPEDNNGNFQNSPVFEDQTLQKIQEIPEKEKEHWILNRQAMKRAKPEELKLAKDALEEFNSIIYSIVEKGYLNTLNETKSKNRIIATIDDVRTGMRLAFEEEVELNTLELNKELTISFFEERKKHVQERKLAWTKKGGESNECNGELHTSSDEATQITTCVSTTP